MRKKWELTPFGIEAKKRMLEKGITHEELAKRVGITACYVGVIFRGKNGSDELIERIAKELGIVN